MNIFTLLLLLVGVVGVCFRPLSAFSVSDHSGDPDHHGCRGDHHADQGGEDGHAVPHGVTEADVIRELKGRNGKCGLPDSDGLMEVDVGLNLMSVTELNVDQGYMEVAAYLSLQWMDPRLRFRYSHPFHEVKEVRLSKDDVWLPDIELYNQVSSGMRIMNTAKNLVLVGFNGNVTWVPMLTSRSMCSPGNNSDEVQCEMKFGSWTYHGNLLDLHIYDKMSPLSSYKPSGQWVATDVSTKRVSVKYACCPDSYVYISFTVTLKKNA